MSSSIQETKNLILQYLKRFPQAKDTPDGIAHWWINRNKEDVAIALKELIREDLIFEKNLGNKKLYGLMNREG